MGSLWSCGGTLLSLSVFPLPNNRAHEKQQTKLLQNEAHSAEIPVLPTHILGLSLSTTDHIIHSLLIPVLSVSHHQPLSWGVTLVPAAALTQSLKRLPSSRKLKMEKTTLCRCVPSLGACTLCRAAGSYLLGLGPAVSWAISFITAS